MAINIRNKSKEQFLKLAIRQSWVWSVSNFIFLASAYYGAWWILSLTNSASQWQRVVGVHIIAELAIPLEDPAMVGIWTSNLTIASPARRPLDRPAPSAMSPTFAIVRNKLKAFQVVTTISKFHNKMDSFSFKRFRYVINLTTLAGVAFLLALILPSTSLKLLFRLNITAVNI